MDTLAYIAQLPIANLLLLVVVVVVLKKRYKIDVLRLILGSKNDGSPEGNDRQLELMEHLKAHYNDELSDTLKEQSQVLKEIRDGVIDTNRKLEVFDRHGIPCAADKK